MDTFNDLISKYLWKQERARIPLDILSLTKDNGGLKLVNLKAKEQSLKINWILSYMQNIEIKILADHCLDNQVGEFIWQYNLHFEDIESLFRNSFWREVLVEWSKFRYHNPKNIMQIKNMPTWGSSLLKIDNKLVFNNRAIRNGLTMVSQILRNDLTFKSFSELDGKYCGLITFVQYYGICKSLPFYWRRILNVVEWKVNSIRCNRCNLIA